MEEEVFTSKKINVQSYDFDECIFNESYTLAPCDFVIHPTFSAEKFSHDVDVPGLAQAAYVYTGSELYYVSKTFNVIKHMPLSAEMNDKLKTCLHLQSMPPASTAQLYRDPLTLREFKNITAILDENPHDVPNVSCTRLIDANFEFIQDRAIEIGNEACDQVILMVGSHRQSKRCDKFYAQKSATINTGSCYSALTTLCDELNKKPQVQGLCKVDGYLLADTYGNRHKQENFDKSIQDSKSYQFADCFDDTSKLTILYAQMHHIAASHLSHPDDKIIFNYYSGDRNALKNLKHFFKTHKDLLPPRVKLRLYDYSGLDVTCIGEIQANEDAIIDFNYDQNVKLMVSSLFHAPKEYNPKRDYQGRGNVLARFVDNPQKLTEFKNNRVNERKEETATNKLANKAKLLADIYSQHEGWKFGYPSDYYSKDTVESELHIAIFPEPKNVAKAYAALIDILEEAGVYFKVMGFAEDTLANWDLTLLAKKADESIENYLLRTALDNDQRGKEICIYHRASKDEFSPEFWKNLQLKCWQKLQEAQVKFGHVLPPYGDAPIKSEAGIKTPFSYSLNFAGKKRHGRLISEPVKNRQPNPFESIVITKADLAKYGLTVPISSAVIQNNRLDYYSSKLENLEENLSSLKDFLNDKATSPNVYAKTILELKEKLKELKFDIDSEKAKQLFGYFNKVSKWLEQNFPRVADYDEELDSGSSLKMHSHFRKFFNYAGYVIIAISNQDQQEYAEKYKDLKKSLHELQKFSDEEIEKTTQDFYTYPLEGWLNRHGFTREQIAEKVQSQPLLMQCVYRKLVHCVREKNLIDSSWLDMLQEAATFRDDLIEYIFKRTTTKWCLFSSPKMTDADHALILKYLHLHHQQTVDYSKYNQYEDYDDFIQQTPLEDLNHLQDQQGASTKTLLELKRKITALSPLTKDKVSAALETLAKLDEIITRLDVTLEKSMLGKNMLPDKESLSTFTSLKETMQDLKDKNQEVEKAHGKKYYLSCLRNWGVPNSGSDLDKRVEKHLAIMDNMLPTRPRDASL